MSERLAREVGAFEDSRTWRRLLARLHPDAGGDHELFLFACALKEELCSRTLDLPGGYAASDPSFRVWRSGLSSWASRNRAALRRDRTRRARDAF